MRLRLTDLAIRKLPHPKRGQIRYWDQSTPAFGVSVSQKSKTFIIMQGKNRRLRSLGRYPDMTLSEARSEAKRTFSMPVVANRSTTHEKATEAFLDEAIAKNRPKTVDNYRLFITKLVFDGPVEKITRADLRPFLNDPHTLTALKVYFNWCLRNDLIDRNPIAADRVQYAPSRSRVLTPDELRAIWKYERPPYSDVLKLCILTGQRRGELAAIVDEWINGDTLTFPASITKNKREHTIPISELALKYLPVEGFAGWSKAKARISRLVPLPHWTVHDLRRTFSTIHAEIGTPIHVTEKLLNHVSGTHSGVQAIYNRHTYLTEMRMASNAYQAHLETFLPI